MCDTEISQPIDCFAIRTKKILPLKHIYNADETDCILDKSRRNCM